MIHNGIKLLTLTLYACTHHTIYAIASIYFYFFQIVEQPTNCKIRRPDERSNAVSISELSRLSMRYTFTVAWTYYSYINTLVVDKEGQAIKELLLIFVKCFSQRFKICKIKTIDECTFYSFVYCFLICFRNYLVYYKTHSATIRNECSKANSKHTDCSRAKIAQLQIKLTAIS